MAEYKKNGGSNQYDKTPNKKRGISYQEWFLYISGPKTTYIANILHEDRLYIFW